MSGPTQWRNLPDRILFGPASQGPAPRARILHGLRYPYALLRDLVGGKLTLYAMSLVYATLLAMIPLLAFSFAVLKAFGVHRLLEPLVFDFFQPMGAAAGEFTQRVMGFAAKVHSGLVGSVGLVLLIWTLIGTLKKVEDSFNFVWHVDVARRFARRVAEYLALMIMGPLAIAAVVGLSRLAVESAPLRLLSALPLIDRFTALGLNLAPFVIVSLLLTMIYILVPNTRVRIAPAVAGGIFAGILWAAVGRVFTLFVLYSARLTIVYAGFAIFVAALLWTYLGWIILLLGAQLSFYLQNPSYLRLGLRQLYPSGEDTLRLGLGIMYLIAHARQSGAPDWNISTLAARLDAPGNTIARLCTALAAAGLMVSTRAGTLLPARDSAHIRLLDVVLAAHRYSTGHTVDTRHLPPAVTALCSELDQYWRQCCGERTLDELLAGDGHLLKQQ